MNLLSKIKPEYVSMLKQEAETYPFLVENIMTELRTKDAWIYLKIGTCIDLENILNLPTSNRLGLNINSLFNE